MLRPISIVFLVSALALHGVAGVHWHIQLPHLHGETLHSAMPGHAHSGATPVSYFRPSHFEAHEGHHDVDVDQSAKATGKQQNVFDFVFVLVAFVLAIAASILRVTAAPREPVYTRGGSRHVRPPPHAPPTLRSR
jgi:hypothetical protein